jgi:hypothetical protein
MVRLERVKEHARSPSSKLIASAKITSSSGFLRTPTRCTQHHAHIVIRHIPHHGRALHLVLLKTYNLQPSVGRSQYSAATAIMSHTPTSINIHAENHLLSHTVSSSFLLSYH